MKNTQTHKQQTTNPQTTNAQTTKEQMAKTQMTNDHETKKTKKNNVINRLRRTYEPKTNKQFERLQPQRRRIFIIASFKNKQSIGGCNKKASFEFPLFLMNV